MDSIGSSSVRLRWLLLLVLAAFATAAACETSADQPDASPYNASCSVDEGCPGPYECVELSNSSRVCLIPCPDGPGICSQTAPLAECTYIELAAAEADVPYCIDSDP